MHSPYLYTLRRIAFFAGKLLPILFMIKVTLLFFYFIGNYQNFTSATTVLLIRFLLYADICICLAGLINLPWILFKWHSPLLKIGDFIMTLCCLLFSVMTMSSALVILALMNG